MKITKDWAMSSRGVAGSICLWTHIKTFFYFLLKKVSESLVKNYFILKILEEMGQFLATKKIKNILFEVI